MSIYFNNTTPSNIYYNGTEATLYYNGEQIWPENINYNPLNLPDRTFRILLTDNTSPSTDFTVRTRVSTNPNIWDVKVGVNNASFITESGRLLEVIGANASGCHRFNNTFSKCTALSAVSVFDTSNASAIYSMFENCSSLKSVPLFPISTSVSSTQNMFKGCVNLTTVSRLNLSNVATINKMFSGCSSLSAVPEFDLSNVTSTNMAFLKCYNLKTIPNFNFKNVIDFYETFYYCSGLTSIPLFNLPKVTNVGVAFRGCYNVNNGALALYNTLSEIPHSSIQPSRYAVFRP